MREGRSKTGRGGKWLKSIYINKQVSTGAAGLTLTGDMLRGCTEHPSGFGKRVRMPLTGRGSCLGYLQFPGASELPQWMSRGMSWGRDASSHLPEVLPAGDSKPQVTPSGPGKQAGQQLLWWIRPDAWVLDKCSFSSFLSTSTLKKKKKNPDIPRSQYYWFH